jgi:hypothetical protein
MFVPDGQSDRSRTPERICAGQTDKEGQAIVQDRFSLSGIASRPGGHADGTDADLVVLPSPD